MPHRQDEIAILNQRLDLLQLPLIESHNLQQERLRTAQRENDALRSGSVQLALMEENNALMGDLACAKAKNQALKMRVRELQEAVSRAITTAPPHTGSNAAAWIEAWRVGSGAGSSGARCRPLHLWSRDLVPADYRAAEALMSQSLQQYLLFAGTDTTPTSTTPTTPTTTTTTNINPLQGQRLSLDLLTPGLNPRMEQV
ncbi:hypothetical protein B484DRAFT_406944 [Ochromonadaceae sp. CCMP2298]|nr:hypothetical protein B484DRAFT_406944 [Ochromonadaceae sp. CCMP2298]